MYVHAYRRPKVGETDTCSHQSQNLLQRLGSHTSAVFCRERVCRSRMNLPVLFSKSHRVREDELGLVDVGLTFARGEKNLHAGAVETAVVRFDVQEDR